MLTKIAFSFRKGGKYAGTTDHERDFMAWRGGLGSTSVRLADPLAGPHPLAAYAAFLANALRPGAKYVSIVGSYGWGGKTVETLAGMIPNLKVEVLEPVLCKGVPKAETLQALDALAESIA